MKSQIVDDDEFNNVNSGDPPIWIPEGTYPARWIDRTITLTPRGDKSRPRPSELLGVYATAQL